MTYYVEYPVDAPFIQVGVELVGFLGRVTDRGRRAEISNIFRNGRGLLNPEEMPDYFRCNTQIDKLPDFFLAYGSIKICSDRMWQTLEELDPGLHQFIPKTMTETGGEKRSAQFHIVNIHHMLDSIIDEKTKTQTVNFSGTPLDRNNMHLAFCYKDFDVCLRIRETHGITQNAKS